ncbi:MAG: N-acetylmuramoyl-L-alanine amidase family protein [Armatimonadota bacterium]
MKKHRFTFITLTLLIAAACLLLRTAGYPQPAGPVICLDPGHPSEVNSGAAVQNGLREVEVNYDVALLVKETLEEELHARVVLTRDFRGYDPKRPRVVTNVKRAEIANAAQADLLLRLHCDTGKGRGFTVYYPDRQATKQGKTGPSAAVRTASAQCAKALHGGMAEVLKGVLRDNGVKAESATYIGRKQGALTGSIYSEVPVVTVEMLFLSHKGDADYIRGKDGKRQMADALAIGVARCVSRE